MCARRLTVFLQASLLAGGACAGGCSDVVLGEFRDVPNVVAVGDEGLVLASYDGGRSFPAVRSGPEGGLEDAVIVGDRVVAVGREWLESEDGTQWRITIEDHEPLTAVVTFDDRLIGVGAEGTVISSDGDAVVVGSVSDDPDSGIPLEALVQGDDRVLAIAETGEVYVSGDGEDWVAGAGTGFDVTSAAFGNGVFVIVGDDAGRLATSDGLEVVATQSRADDPWISDVTFGDARFIAVGLDVELGGGLVYESRDGRNWAVTSIPERLSSVAWTGEAFVASDGDALYRSADGLAWSQVERDMDLQQPIKDLAAAPVASRVGL